MGPASVDRYSVSEESAVSIFKVECGRGVF